MNTFTSRNLSPADGEYRFPLVERALADVPALSGSDPEYAAGIRRHAENLVRRSRGLPGMSCFTALHARRAVLFIRFGRVAGEETPRVGNGAREEQQQPRRNGASHDEAPRDEGMEISDG